MSNGKLGDAGAARADTAEPEAGSPHVSGVRRAVRPPSASEALISALADAASGRLVETSGAATSALESFAAELPELFEVALTAHGLEAGRLESKTAGLQDLVLVSPTRVHVAQRLVRNPRAVLLSVADREASVGWVVSEARSELARR